MWRGDAFTTGRNERTRRIDYSNTLMGAVAEVAVDSRFLLAGIYPRRAEAAPAFEDQLGIGKQPPGVL